MSIVLFLHFSLHNLTNSDIMNSTEVTMMFAEKLKALRKQKGLTQTQFAIDFNIATGTIGMWETGKRQPDYNTLVKIAKYFDVSINYLLEDQAEPEDYKLLVQEQENYTKIIVPLLFKALKRKLVHLMLPLDSGMKVQVITLMTNFISLRICIMFQ